MGAMEERRWPPLGVILSLIALRPALAALTTTDLLLQARCHAYCSTNQQQQQCQESCAKNTTTKPGTCPGGLGPPLTLGCVEECKEDLDCSGFDKCCKHPCGITCQPPPDLDQQPGLPDIPAGVTVSERRKSKSVTVSWGEVGGGAVYLVEWRQQPGWRFKESGLGAWSPARRRPLAAAPFKTTLTPAIWYQFRVAAVNPNGTKGYSQPSKPFKLSIPPSRPGPPENLTTGPVTYKNNTVTVVFKWKQPLSDLPINRYIVSWTRRIASDLIPAAQGSVVMHQKSVGPEKTSIRLKNLQPNSEYFFQVQAQAQYGKKRYQSETSRIVFRTSAPSDQGAQVPTREKLNKGKKLQIHLAKYKILDGKLCTKVSWKSQPNMKYAVTLESTCGPLASKSIVVLGPHFDISDLKFDCTYNILLREKSGGKKRRRHGNFTFATPPCSNFTPPAC